ncbi:hypothetical protein [Actinoplanes subtropicus]|uniref:hypothetical protein n=1 Tax=Actinoplanes subtropicus TaxID=543632 RepID=UPI001FDECED2|nr:hypothetical protein [Actinoplanes subtropicus]
MVRSWRPIRSSTSFIAARLCWVAPDASSAPAEICRIDSVSWRDASAASAFCAEISPVAEAIRSAACCCLATERACRRPASVSPLSGRVDTGAATGRAGDRAESPRPVEVLVVRGMAVVSRLG